MDVFNLSTPQMSICGTSGFASRAPPRPDAREFGALDLGFGQVLQDADAHRLGGEDSNVSVSAILKESPPCDRLRTIP